MQHAYAIIMPVYWYTGTHCNFQLYRLVLCNIRPCAIAVIRRRISCLNTVVIQIIAFFQGGDIGREVAMEIVVEV